MLRVAFQARRRSPVRYDSSITPCASARGRASRARQKVAITRAEIERARWGTATRSRPSEITTEAAGAVIMDTSLRRIALQSAVGGMAPSVVGMFIAFGGWLPPVGGAVFQEVIDLAAVLNALRAAVPGGELSDY